MSMKQWIADAMNMTGKKPLPVVSYPVAQQLGIPIAQLTKQPEAQAQAAVYLVRELDMPAVLTSMDLAVEAACFGAEVDHSQVPVVKGPILTDMEEAETLTIPAVNSPYMEAVRLIKEEIQDRPVFAGISGPFSLAGQLRGMTDLMMDCYDEPELLEILLEKLTTFLIQYARKLKAAGADGVLLAEPLAGVISPVMAAQFSHPYVKKMIDDVQDDDFAILYHNCGGGVTQMLPDLMALGAMGYHFGNAVKMEEILPHMGPDVLVMGNVDPAGVIAHGSREAVREAASKLQRSCGQYSNFWLSTGCDIPPDAPWENIEEFMNCS